MSLRALEGLNPAQQEAVRTIDGPLLILAGPGSGKTRVIVHRIAHMLENGVDASSIVAVTFTNKAAREMRERLEHLVGGQAQKLTVGTFHATCARWLRREIHHLGYPPGFAIYDDRDQVDLMKEVIRELSIDEKRFTPRMILHEISSAKSELIGPHEYSEHAEGRWRELVGRAYHRYQSGLQENRALDFDDLLMLTVRLFQEFPPVLERYQKRYRYVMVDEFQDTNIAQYQLTRLLSEKHQNICVVGDPDQSIYGWRKADIRNILNFERDYPKLKVVVLEQNYRSTQNILDVAHAVISQNELRKEKNLWTDNPGGGAVTLFEAFDEREEAQFVVREIERVTRDGARRGDVAVMYRTNAQSRAVEDVFVRYGVPYRLVGGTRFYERREVKDVLAYLRLVANPYDGVSLQRVINVPARGLGTKTVSELGRWARARKLALYDALVEAAGRAEPEALEDSSAAPVPFTPRARQSLRAFVDVLIDLRDIAGKVAPVELLTELLNRTAYERFLRDGTEDGEERWSNVLELVSKAQDYEQLEPEVALQRFLEEVSLVQDVDSLEGDGDAATLITLHAAKGLEFPYVFILGLEEGLSPHTRSLDDPGQMEEERRLFYVGVTRAMRGLYLLYAKRRLMHGGGSTRDPSRFLHDIPSELLNRHTPRAPSLGPRGRDSWSGSRSPSASHYRLEAPMAQPAGPEPAWLTEPERLPQSAVASNKEPSFQSGDKVTHAAFGDGIVMESRILGDDEQVTVLFKGQPAPKKISLSFAPLQKV